MMAKIMSRTLSAIMSAALILTALPTAALAEEPIKQSREASEENLLKLWYDEPASEGINILSAGSFSPTEEDNNWQQHTLPIGNSFMGANVYGEIAKERLTFNQKTLWNGGPSESRPDYDGGNIDKTSQWQECVNAFLAGDDATGSQLAGGLVGEGEAAGYGVYQSWGDIYLNYKNLAGLTSAGDTTDYERNLDLTTGIANVDFAAKGTDYHREFFISYPDNVLAMKLTADGAETLDLNVSFPIDNGEENEIQSNKNSKLAKENETYDVTVGANEGTIVSAAQMQDNQMKMNSVLTVATDKGTVAKGSDNSSLDISGADEVIIFISASTDYKNDYPKYRTGETNEQLAKRVKATVDNAVDKGYDKVKSRYLADYQELFGRVDLDLGQAASGKTTDQLLATYKKSGEDGATASERRLLEVLLYQYGRYLTIASSRDGDLPSTLQGVWQNRVGTSGRIPWGSDFHMNVNLQMNYWPTYSANLAECATPIVDYVNSLREPGRVTAENYFGIKSEPGEANGFSAHTQNSPFGWTCPGWAFDWGWSPAAVPWIIQNCWEYYEYTGDVDYMRTHLYPMMKEETLLYDQILVDSGQEITLDDGTKSTRLVSAPAYSSEHGPRTLGNVYENVLVWQLYEDTITAAEVLGVDEDLVERWKETKERLAPIEVGDSGQIKEWYIEGEYGKKKDGTTIPGFQDGHRHMSHMLGLFPGDAVSVENEEYINAAIYTLERRGYESTGWGMGQRLNAWARTGKGNTAYLLVQNLFKGGIYPNLWDSHAPFQIDGNFGYTSGVDEMLMQSNVGYINILPALPDEWSEGSVNGIVARGNFELGIDWADGKATEIRLLSKNGGECVVQYPGIGVAEIKDSDGNTVTYTPVEGKANRIQFETVKGKSYTIQKIGEDVRPAAPTNGVATENTNGIVLTWDAVAGADSYNVYRKIDRTAIAEKINQTAVTSATFTDTKEYEDKYAVLYSVTAVKDGAESVRSEEFKLPDPQLPIEVIDQTDDRVKYTDSNSSNGGNNWDNYSEAGNYGGSMTFIENTLGEESVELPFNGTGIAIIMRKNSEKYAHTWKVYIDGQAQTDGADCSSASAVHQQVVFAKYDLSAGQHTIKLSTEGVVGGKLEVDAFVVYADTDAALTVSYDLNGLEGTAPSAAKQKCRDTITLPVCDSEGFQGWSDGSDTTYQAGNSYQLSYSDVTFTAVYEEEVINTTDEYLSVPHTGWQASAGSEENSGTDGPASSAIDGDEATWWHSNYDNNGNAMTDNEGVNNWFTIDFGKEITIDKFEYVPRVGVTDANGFITGYTILGSNAAEGDFTEIKSGTWEFDHKKHMVEFDGAVTLRRIQIKATATNGSLGANKHIHAAEFNVYQKNPNYGKGLPYLSVSKSLWTASAGSEQASGNDGPASDAIDGDEDTKWHSNYSGNHEPVINKPDQENANNDFTIDFGEAIDVDQFEYIGKSNNGKILAYEIWSSQTADQDDFVKITEGTWENNDLPKIVKFSETQNMRRIRIYATRTGGGTPDKYIHANEFNVYVKNKDYTSPVITVQNPNITLDSGASGKINASVNENDTGNTELTYMSSDPLLVFVYPDGSLTASAYKSGIATITVTSAGDEEVTETVTVTVNPPTAVDVERVTLENTRLILKAGEEKTLVATIEPTFGTDKTITWTSDNTNAATVDSGKITAVAAGTAIITAKTVNNKTATCEVVVTDQVETADRRELSSAVIKAKNKDLSIYTEESVNAYNEALKEAEDVLALGTSVLQTEVDDALRKLQEAEDGLEVKEGTPVTIRYSANPAAGGNITAVSGDITGANGAIRVTSGASVTLTATAAEGYTFKGWYKGSEKAGSDAQLTISNVAADADYEARFKETGGGDEEPDKSALEDAIQAFRTKYSAETAKYSEVVKGAFDKAIEAAQSVIDDPDATEQDIAEAVTQLGTADTNLTALINEEKAAGKDTFKTAIAEIKAEYTDLVTRYSEEIQAQYNKAINDAETVLNDAEAGKTEIDDAKAALDTAIAEIDTAMEKEDEGKPVDKTELQTSLNAFKDKYKDLEQYSDLVKQKFDDAVTAVEEVLNKDNPTMREINAALGKLTATDTALTAQIEQETAAGKPAFKNEIEAFKKKYPDLSKYSEGVQQAFNDAVTAAENVLNNPEADKDAIDAALADLKKAGEELDAKIKEEDKEQPAAPNRTVLKNELDAAKKKSLTAYTPNSVTAYRKAIIDAQRVYDNASATQTQINTAAQALRNAASKLVRKADFTKLNAAITAAGKINLAEYTQATVNVFRLKLNAAKTVLNNQNATQVQVNQALANLQAAQKALQKAIPTTIKTTDIVYNVTNSSATNGTVSVSGLTSAGAKKSTITIPPTVVENGYTFKVTAIDKNVFAKNKKLKKVIIGENVTNIESKSFEKCSRLATIQFKSTKAPKVGKQAFKGIKSKVKVFYPKKMKKKELNKLKTAFKKSKVKKVTYKKK